MNKSFATILSAALLLVALPVVAADETHPDCEADQPFISYPSEGETAHTVGETSPVFVCEGEHWDGQDPVSDEPTKENQPCLVTSGTHVNLCQGPGAGEEGSNALAGKPVTLRLSTAGSQVYFGFNIDLVGQVIVYTDGKIVAAYIEDGNPLNVAASAVSAAGITQGHVSEVDCDQATYEAGAYASPDDEANYRKCGRDNTAITVVLLP